MRLVKRAGAFLRSDSSFAVHPAICKAIQTVQTTTEEGSLACGYASYGYSVHSQTGKDNKTVTGADVYNALTSLTKTGTQRELFALINGQNLGIVLMKDYLDEPMNAAEIEMLQRWESPETVMFASIGLLCANHNSKDDVTQIADEIDIPPYAQKTSRYRHMHQ